MRLRKLAAASLLCAALTVPCAGLTLEVDGEDCTARARAFAAEETTYVGLRAMATMLDPEVRLNWSDGTATVVARGVTLTARPGDSFILADGEPVAAKPGVRAENGSIYVPLRALCTALGGTARWDGSRGTAVMCTALPEEDGPAQALPAEDVPDQVLPAEDAPDHTLSAETPDGTTEEAPAEETERSWSDEDLYWLSRIISAESRGEPFQGKLAVGTVVLNRVESPEFPDTIYGVIFDMRWGGQFEPVRNGTVYDEPTGESVTAARMCLEGAREAGDSLYFLAPALTGNHWAMENCTYVTTIGAHWFYK